MFNQKGITHIFVLILLLLGIIAGVYLVQKAQIFKPKAFESHNVLQVLGQDNKPTDIVDNVDIKLQIILPSGWKLEGSTLDATYTLKGFYIENKDNGAGGHEPFYITSESSEFSKYLS